MKNPTTLLVTKCTKGSYCPKILSFVYCYSIIYRTKFLQNSLNRLEIPFLVGRINVSYGPSRVINLLDEVTLG